MKDEFMLRKVSIKLLALFICIAVSIVASISYGADYKEGIFQVSLPSSISRVSKSKLDALRTNMMGGVKELAEASKLADPRDISEKGMSFLSAFQNQNGQLLLVFMGMPSPTPMNFDEMYRINSERIKWGIDSGRLSNTSKGVSKLSIDGIPCLLQDIELKGSRMQTYLFILPEAPKGTFQFAVQCDDKATWDENAPGLEAILRSLKIVRKIP
jgi:hypothetical protein